MVRRSPAKDPPADAPYTINHAFDEQAGYRTGSILAVPWTEEIRRIPAIALRHHEKLNGTGYSNKLSAPDIPIQTRMMTIADIFDALAAADRPYKKAVPVDRALDILGEAVHDGELDADLFAVFVGARIFDRWQVESRPY